MKQQFGKRLLGLIMALCLAFSWAMPTVMAEEDGDQAQNAYERSITVTFWNDKREKETLIFSLEDMAKVCGQGTTWDRVPWNSFYSYFQGMYQGYLCSDDVIYGVRPHGIVLYGLDSPQVFRPGMHVFIYPKSDLIEVSVTPDGDDIFINFYNGVNMESFDINNSKTMYFLESNTRWDGPESDYTWGAVIDDFLLFYELNQAVERGDWYFKSGTILGAKIGMEKPVHRNPSEPSKPVINIGPGQVDTERPNFVNKSYTRYYNGQGLDTSSEKGHVFELEHLGTIWSTPSAHFEIKNGHDEGLDEYRRWDGKGTINAGEYTMRRAIINNSGHHFNAGIPLTIMQVPVVVEVVDATMALGSHDPIFSAKVSLDEDAYIENFVGLDEYDKYDTVTRETLKDVIKNELGNSFFSFEYDTVGGTGTYELRAVEKAGVNDKGGVNQYGNFVIRYIPGVLTVTESVSEPDPEPKPEPKPEPEAVSVTLRAGKQYNGHAPGAARFTFNLADEQGSVIQTKKNTDNGAVSFDSLSFDEEGTYTYYISEVNAGVPVINYDASVYEVTIDVTLNDNVFSADVTYTLEGETAQNGAAFYNTSIDTEPENPTEPTPTEIRDPETPGSWRPDPETGEWVFVPDEEIPLANIEVETPKTGDTATMLWAAVAMVLSGTAMAAAVIYDKRLGKKEN